MSLEGAAKRFLNRVGSPVRRDYVHLKWGWEWNTACQQVLAETHPNRCNFTNILEFRPDKTRYHCSTHDKLCPLKPACPVQKPKRRCSSCNLVFKARVLSNPPRTLVVGLPAALLS